MGGSLRTGRGRAFKPGKSIAEGGVLACGVPALAASEPSVPFAPFAPLVATVEEEVTAAEAEAEAEAEAAAVCADDAEADGN